MLARQRGLIATGQSQKQDLVSYRPARVFVIGVKRTPGFVELLLPPRQSRGISLRIRSALLRILQDLHRLPVILLLLCFSSPESDEFFLCLFGLPLFLVQP